MGSQEMSAVRPDEMCPIAAAAYFNIESSGPLVRAFTFRVQMTSAPVILNFPAADEPGMNPRFVIDIE